MTTLVFGHKSADRSDDVLLKAHLPGNNTVIRAAGSSTVMEVIEIIGQKKALDVNEYSVRLVMANGTEIEPERMSTKISEFDLVGVTMYKREENPSPAGRRRSCRRVSISAPKETVHHRMPSGGFPKTVATEAELVERMGRIPEYTFGAPSIRRRVQPGILYKAISSKMFKKERESTENGSPLAFFTSTEEAAADAERLARSSFDISAPDGNAPFKFSSTSTLNAYVGSSVLPPLSGSVGCLANAGTWRDASDGGNALREEESKLTPVPAIFRKRTCSSPSSNPSTATLRRINFQTHTRTRSDGRLALEGDQGDATCHRITIALPAGRPPMILKIVATTVMENILLYTCNTCGLDFEKFTLEAAGGLVDVQLDRNVNYYAAVRGISDFAVVEKEKHYSLKWVTEDGKDTMVLQLIEKDWVVMAATEDKLIERVTDGSLPPDYEFIDTVLLTFRSFMRPAEFFDRLVARFNAELPENAKPDDVQYFEKVKGPTQLRCIVTLEWWIEHYFQDFAEDKELRDDLADVVVQISGHLSYAERANRLKGLIEKKVESHENLTREHSRNSNRKSMESMVSLAMFTPEDLAQQLCLHDFELFRRIEAVEYLNHILGKTEEGGSPWLDKFILLFDKTSYWAATEICLAKEKKIRIKVLEILILLAKACLHYGNFFTMFALIAGLGLSPVSRLKATWESLPKQTRTVFDDLEKITDPSKNMKNYRDCLQQTSPPIVPFLPIYLKDLTFINDGNELRLFGIMINFDKLRMMARRVRDIADMANFEYPFESKPVIMNYLNNATIIKDLAALREMSLECEPKT